MDQRVYRIDYVNSFHRDNVEKFHVVHNLRKDVTDSMDYQYNLQQPASINTLRIMLFETAEMPTTASIQVEETRQCQYFLQTLKLNSKH